MRHITYHDQNGVCFAEGYSIYRQVNPPLRAARLAWLLAGD